jgi:sn-glycerol 3-phosphate transport system ATP-binding protein
VADNITFGLSVRKMAAAEQQVRLDETAQLLGLSTLLLRKPSQLSGGQQQRVALARALVARANVCLMDEPLSNLDAQLRQEMRQELRELQQRLGLTLVYVTHDPAEAMSMADQVVLLNRGRMEQAADPRELYARPASRFAGEFIGTPAMNLLSLTQGCISGTTTAAGPSQARHLGVRPEDISLSVGADQGLAARVHSLEYLGADLVLRCAAGDQMLRVRTGGQTRLTQGQEVFLHWPAQASHFFDSDGQRIS